MPKRELSRPQQVIDWLEDWGQKLNDPGEMILIGSGGLLWHVAKAGRNDPLPSNSMDVDPVTSDEAIAQLAYDAVIGSEFELEHGWHVNLMPDMVLRSLPSGWRERSRAATYGNLKVIIPSVADLLVPKMERSEPRDVAQRDYMKSLGLLKES